MSKISVLYIVLLSNLEVKINFYEWLKCMIFGSSVSEQYSCYLRGNGLALVKNVTNIMIKLINLYFQRFIFYFLLVIKYKK